MLSPRCSRQGVRCSRPGALAEVSSAVAEVSGAVRSKSQCEGRRSSRSRGWRSRAHARGATLVDRVRAESRALFQVDAGDWLGAGSAEPMARQARLVLAAYARMGV